MCDVGPSWCRKDASIAVSRSRCSWDMGCKLSRGRPRGHHTASPSCRASRAVRCASAPRPSAWPGRSRTDARRHEPGEAEQEAEGRRLVAAGDARQQERGDDRGGDGQPARQRRGAQRARGHRGGEARWARRCPPASSTPRRRPWAADARRPSTTARPPIEALGEHHAAGAVGAASVAAASTVLAAGRRVVEDHRAHAVARDGAGVGQPAAGAARALVGEHDAVEPPRPRTTAGRRRRARARHERDGGPGAGSRRRRGARACSSSRRGSPPACRQPPQPATQRGDEHEARGWTGRARSSCQCKRAPACRSRGPDYDVGRPRSRPLRTAKPWRGTSRPSPSSKSSWNGCAPSCARRSGRSSRSSPTSTRPRSTASTRRCRRRSSAAGCGPRTCRPTSAGRASARSSSASCTRSWARRRSRPTRSATRRPTRATPRSSRWPAPTSRRSAGCTRCWRATSSRPSR